MKNLLLCPICEHQGRKNVLGEIDPHGDLLVLRFHNGVTRIIGESFTVMCEYHNEPIFVRKGVDNTGTIHNLRKSWIFGFSSIQQVGTIGTYGTAG